MTKFESSVKVIPHSQERVYGKLSNLNNLESLKDRLPQEQIKDMTFDADTLSFSVAPVGQLTLKIIEREPCKCIKFEAVGSPIPFNLWIQLVAIGDDECKIRITAGLEINPFMKAMVQKPLHDGLEKMVDTLSMINYD